MTDNNNGIMPELRHYLREHVQKVVNTIADLVPAIIYINDISKMENVFMSANGKTFLGYDPKEYSGRGLDFFLQLIHPDDLHILPSSMDYLNKEPEGIYRIDYRVKHKNGDWRWVKGSGRIVEWEKGQPKYLLGVAFDAEQLFDPEIKNDKYQRDMEWLKKNLQNFLQLTKREKEILKLIVLEKSSHEIAETLFISEQTVYTHRKKLMKKLDITNSVGLARFAIFFGIQ